MSVAILTLLIFDQGLPVAGHLPRPANGLTGLRRFFAPAHFIDKTHSYFDAINEHT